jgi:hypothetical protein
VAPARDPELVLGGAGDTIEEVKRMGLFRRKSREMADQVRDAVPGMEPKGEQGIGTAGYDSIRYNKKIDQPRRFNMKRPDGQPIQPKGAQKRGRGFFS